MDEYISREKTVKAFCEKCKSYNGGHCIHRGECGIDVIQTVPAADVQPVKHSYWFYPFSELDVNRCWECGMHVQDKINNVRETFKYCPHCGARMDGDSEC